MIDYTITYNFSPEWKVSIIPLLKKDNKKFISERNVDLDRCFGQLEQELTKIDLSSNVGYSWLLRITTVVEELRRYKFELNKRVSTGKDHVPYTSSQKGRNYALPNN